MTKAERKKISLRNLKKAWAAKRKKKVTYKKVGTTTKRIRATPLKRKNPLKRPLRRKLTTAITGLQSLSSSINKVAEKRGPAIVLSMVAKWCYKNAAQLEAAEAGSDWHYKNLGDELIKIATIIRRRGL